jgi:predicted phosphodiesterase
MNKQKEALVSDSIIASMALCVISDVHLEFYKQKHPKCLFEIHDCDTLVIAGDFGYPFNRDGKPNHHYFDILSRLSEQYAHVIYVAGNHEYYQCNQLKKTTEETDEMIHAMCIKLGIHFLQKSVWVHPTTQVTFVGCTLWTDIDESGAANMNDVVKASKVYDGGMYETRRPKPRPGVFSDISEYQALHEDHLEWLQKTLTEMKTPTIVVTHHLPSFAAVPEKFADNNNSGYATELDHLFRAPIIAWLCGHSHEPGRFVVNDIPLVLNPIGYPGEKQDAPRSRVPFIFPI